MPTPASQIKGYLPVRLKLGEEDESFFYIREHHGGQSGTTKQGCTLFVANAPIVPGISTRILLKSLLGRYEDITRVSVVPNPRQTESEERSSVCASWSDKVQNPSFLPPIYSEGKYAHVVFASFKAMKKTLQAMHDVMRQKENKPGLTLERIEIQTLADESANQHRKNQKKILGQEEDGDDESDDEDDDEVDDHKQTGILAVAQRYQRSCTRLSRAELLEECNAVMTAYEKAEEDKRRAQAAAKEQPDGDGFVTVSYSTAVGSKAELEESNTASATHSRRKGNKRNRKKKEAAGSSELGDFYRFQRRDNKKRSLADLRTQFEEDLKKVKRMKEEHHYRPF
jgi:ribosomal RNA-processing protein 7